LLRELARWRDRGTWRRYPYCSRCTRSHRRPTSALPSPARRRLDAAAESASRGRPRRPAPFVLVPTSPGYFRAASRQADRPSSSSPLSPSRRENHADLRATGSPAIIAGRLYNRCGRQRPKELMSNSSLVYSTGGGRVDFCPTCGLRRESCRCPRKAAPSRSASTLPNDGIVRLLRDRKGRGGKTVTVIAGVRAN